MSFTNKVGHRPRKRFGQHFLVDRAYIGRIIDAIGPHAEDLMVEIGPGPGALTVPLIEHLRHLHVVEIDRDIAAELRRRFPSERLTVHQIDALKFDFAALGSRLRVVGNLPYNISSPLLFHVGTASLVDCHFMLQKEVVDRMAAAPGSKAFGRLSVMMQYRFQVQKLFNVPAGAFRPPPQVESAFVRLLPRAALPLSPLEEQVLSRMVSKAFSQRRKTLRNALSEFLAESELAELGIEPRLRPENLSVETYVRLAGFVAERARHAPDRPRSAESE
jgi:16S rRNA (adenine1518-N6/adenine1519-N6)-dimethyltransferase